MTAWRGARARGVGGPLAKKPRVMLASVWHSLGARFCVEIHVCSPSLPFPISLGIMYIIFFYFLSLISHCLCPSCDVAFVQGVSWVKKSARMAGSPMQRINSIRLGRVFMREGQRSKFKGHSLISNTQQYIAVCVPNPCMIPTNQPHLSDEGWAVALLVDWLISEPLDVNRPLFNS